MEELNDVEFQDTPVVSEQEIQPEENQEMYSVASAIREGINLIYGLIEYYEGLSTFIDEHILDDDYAGLIDEMKNEENNHIGQLQKMLDSVMPSSQVRQQGEIEAENKLGLPDEYDNTSPLELRDTIQLDPMDKQIEDDFLQKYSDGWG